METPVIEDAQRTGVAATEPRVRIDPRIARRWVEVRREEGRRRLRILLVLLAGSGAIALLAGLLYTPLFRVRHVRVTVSGALPSSQVAKWAGFGHRRLMISVDDGAVARRLDAVPALGDAKVSTHWPGTVSIRVTQRAVVAAIEFPAAGSTAGSTAGSAPRSEADGNRWAEIDATGRVVAEVSSQPPGVPAISGVGVPPPAGQWLPGSAGPGAPARSVVDGSTQGATSKGSGQVAGPSRGGSRKGPLVDMNALSDSPNVPQGVAAALALADELPASVLPYVRTISLGGPPSSAAGSGVPVSSASSSGSHSPDGLWMQMSVPPVPSAASVARSATGKAAGIISVNFGDGSQLAAKLTALATLVVEADLSRVASLDLTVPDRPAALTAG